MKRSTALRHLVEMAHVATDELRLRATEIGWPLEEMWIAGSLLEPTAEIDDATVVLVIDLPPAELPWLAVNPTSQWIGEHLRLGKRPFSWISRPIAWPAWSVRDRTVARFWTAASGLDQAVIDALRAGSAVDVLEPTCEAADLQFAVELDAAKAHLRTILAGYWDDDWRRSTRYLTSPEDHLWRAATAVDELDSATTAHEP